GNAHAGKRRREAALQILEKRAALAARGVHRADHAANRAHGLEQAPEGAEEAKEDEERGEIAQDLAALIKPRLEGIEQGALVERGEAFDRAGERALERTEKIGLETRRRHSRTELGVPPANLAADLPQGMQSEHDAGEERGDDHRVEHGICKKRRDDT